MVLKIILKYWLIIIGVICLWTASNTQWGENSWNSIVESDGKGYYSYLPATIIYHDLHFNFFDSIERKYYSPQTYYDYRIKIGEGKHVNKYFSGTAVLMLPFFLVAHAVTLVTGEPADGFSKYYQVCIGIGAIFYLLCALLFCKKILALFKINNNYSIITLVLFALGTNLFYYTVFEPSMSHIYSFFAISAFLFYTTLFVKTTNTRFMFLGCLILGLIILIRPVNGLIIFAIPILCGNMKLFVRICQKFFSDWKQLFSGALLTLGMISIQLGIYKIQTGNWFFYSYLDEGFNFADPHPLLFLFSFRKGLFIYTPLIFSSLLGLYYFLKKDQFKFISILSFLTLVVLVLSSWWMWWYGGSFGMRPMIEYYPIFMLLFANALNEMSSAAKKTMIGLGITLTIICQVQTVQYRYLQIHWSDMTKEKYFKEFLRIDKVL